MHIQDDVLFDGRESLGIRVQRPFKPHERLAFDMAKLPAARKELRPALVQIIETMRTSGKPDLRMLYPFSYEAADAISLRYDLPVEVLRMLILFEAQAWLEDETSGSDEPEGGFYAWKRIVGSQFQVVGVSFLHRVALPMREVFLRTAYEAHAASHRSSWYALLSGARSTAYVSRLMYSIGCTQTFLSSPAVDTLEGIDLFFPNEHEPTSGYIVQVKSRRTYKAHGVIRLTDPDESELTTSELKTLSTQMELFNLQRGTSFLGLYVKLASSLGRESEDSLLQQLRQVMGVLDDPLTLPPPEPEVAPLG